MPTIVTRGVASARGAGTFSAAPPPPPPVPPPPVPPPPPPPGPPPVYQTVTFTSSGYWTAPAGVNTVISLTVAGGLYSSSEGFFQQQTVYVASYTANTGTKTNIGALTYAQVGAYADTILAAFNSSSPASTLPDRNVTFATLDMTWESANSQYSYEYRSPETYRVLGEAFPGGAWYNRTNEIVGGPSTPPTDWTLQVAVYTPGGAFPGSQSSALGYTAAGTTSSGQAQVVVTQYYVPVTPGQQYYIEVGSSSGYVTLQFNQS